MGLSLTGSWLGYFFFSLQLSALFLLSPWSLSVLIFDMGIISALPHIAILRINHHPSSYLAHGFAGRELWQLQTPADSSSERQNPAPCGSNQWLSLVHGWKVFNPESCLHSQPNSGGCGKPIMSLVNSFGGHMLTESSPAAFTVCKRFFFFFFWEQVLAVIATDTCTASCSRGRRGCQEMRKGRMEVCPPH